MNETKYATIAGGCIAIRDKATDALIGIIIKDKRLTSIYTCELAGDEKIAELISGRSLAANLNPQKNKKDEETP